MWLFSTARRMSWPQPRLPVAQTGLPQQHEAGGGSMTRLPWKQIRVCCSMADSWSRFYESV
jgi:hypothetical protein